MRPEALEPVADAPHATSEVGFSVTRQQMALLLAHDSRRIADTMASLGVRVQLNADARQPMVRVLGSDLSVVVAAADRLSATVGAGVSMGLGDYIHTRIDEPRFSGFGEVRDHSVPLFGSTCSLSHVCPTAGAVQLGCVGSRQHWTWLHGV